MSQKNPETLNRFINWLIDSMTSCCFKDEDSSFQWWIEGPAGLLQTDLASFFPLCLWASHMGPSVCKCPRGFVHVISSAWRLLSLLVSWFTIIYPLDFSSNATSAGKLFLTHHCKLYSHCVTFLHGVYTVCKCSVTFVTFWLVSGSCPGLHENRYHISFCLSLY